jgi:hypothetical protein
MTATFADYAAQAEARSNIASAALNHTLALCEALRHNYIQYSIRGHQRNLNVDNHDYHKEQIEKLKQGITPINFIVDSGRKYHKVIFVDGGGHRSVHAFVDKKTGEVYKSASWKSPAKGVRYDLRLIEQREWLFENADWAGGYLYAK